MAAQSRRHPDAHTTRASVMLFTVGSKMKTGETAQNIDPVLTAGR